MPAPAIMAGIAAIAGLAQAAGAGLQAVSGVQEARKSRRQQSAWHEDDLEQQKRDNELSRARLGLEMDQAQQQRPMSALNFLSGLEDFKQKRAKSGNYLETIRGLAGR